MATSPVLEDGTAADPDAGMATQLKPKTPPTSGKRVRKQCSFAGCTKVDAGGGFCVGHGGGKKCSFAGCTKGYQTGGFCRKHGGGARCQVPGCGKVDAGKGLCRAHGGGKRCQAPECPKADVGGGFCTAHGGGKRCTEKGCDKIDQGGGKCRAHGGARRCRKPDCSQTARGSTGFCTEHGGAKLCSMANCRRIARVHGGKLCTQCAKETAALTMADTVRSVYVPVVASSSPRSLGCNTPVSDTRPSALPSMLVSNAPMTPRMLSLSSLPSPMSLMPSPAPTPAPALPSNADVNEGKLSSSQMASCLENGCARSFGGKCNCKENCTCCRQAAMANKTSASATSQSPAPARESIPEDDKPVPIQLMRLVVQVDSSSLGKEYIVALLSVVPGIRSVHDVTDTADSKETSSPESSKSTNFVLRGDEGFDVARLDVLKSVQGIALRVIKQSTVPWLRKEVVLRVDEMMCPGNCGNTVVRAMRSVPHLEAANLIFDVRQVVARGTMGTDQLCAAVQAVGFEPCVDAVVPIPRRFRFCVSSLLESPFVGKKLIDTLRRVEGVESIVLVTERAEVLVVATLEEATPLLLAAARNGWAMVEVPEHGSAQAMSGRSSLTNSPSSSADDASTNSSALSTENASDHVCDIKVCPRNGCQQYMATVAHTAALAVGWVVPGCAMSWGGECTCGENCKCVGCPKHNPIT